MGSVGGGWGWGEGNSRGELPKGGALPFQRRREGGTEVGAGRRGRWDEK